MDRTQLTSLAIKVSVLAVATLVFLFLRRKRRGSAHPREASYLESFLSEGRIRVPVSLIVEGDLAKVPRAFLVNMGLPTKDDLFFPFVRSADDFEVWEERGKRFLRISAEEGGQRLGVRFPDGAVVIVDENQAEPRCLKVGSQKTIASRSCEASSPRSTRPR